MTSHNDRRGLLLDALVLSLIGAPWFKALSALYSAENDAWHRALQAKPPESLPVLCFACSHAQRDLDPGTGARVVWRRMRRAAREHQRGPGGIMACAAGVSPAVVVRAGDPVHFCDDPGGAACDLDRGSLR